MLIFQPAAVTIAPLKGFINPHCPSASSKFDPFSLYSPASSRILSTTNNLIQPHNDPKAPLTPSNHATGPQSATPFPDIF